jgi:folate-binding protein YgfZ
MPYSALLTPKGRIVSDLRVARIGDGEEGPFLLELPPGAYGMAVERMRQYLPPRFARIDEPGEELGVLSVIGPRGSEVVEAALVEGPKWSLPLQGLEEGDELVIPGPGPFATRVVRTCDVAPPAWDLIMPRSASRGLLERLGALDAAVAPIELWDTLRVERGRPAFGQELDQETLPTEAGIEDRAIDHTKGCYTGQEVIVRIRDRGKVNRMLRGVLLGDATPPAPGTPLFHESRETPVGETRSAVRSPRFGQTIALAYVRREIEPPGQLRLGTVAGPAAALRALDANGWVLVEGDAGSIA